MAQNESKCYGEQKLAILTFEENVCKFIFLEKEK